MESRVRLLLVDGGRGRPVAQYVVRDENGNFVARFDMAYPVYRVGLDYDGRVHLEDEVRFRRPSAQPVARSRLASADVHGEDYYRGGGVGILTEVGDAVRQARRFNAG